jgi:hypothetical protein
LSQAVGVCRDHDDNDIIEWCNDDTVTDSQQVKEFAEAMKLLWGKHGRVRLTDLQPQPRP